MNANHGTKRQKFFLMTLLFLAGNGFPELLSEHAVYWSQENGMMDLGTLGGTNSQAYGINDRSQVVGTSQTASGDYHAFIWDIRNGMQDMGCFCGGSSLAMGVNNNGVVVGQAISGNTASSFMWTAEKGYSDLNIPGNWSWASNINDKNEVVGSTSFSDHSSAYYYHKDLGFIELPSFGGHFYNYGNDINQAGVIVGSATDEAESQHAFSWTVSGGLTALNDDGLIGSKAEGINDKGTIIGWGIGSSGPLYPTLLWTSDGDMKQLPIGGGEIRDIDNDGWIVGGGLWTPSLEGVQAPFDPYWHGINNKNEAVGWVIVSNVPEPSLFFLLGAGLAGLAGLRSIVRKKRPEPHASIDG